MYWYRDLWTAVHGIGLLMAKGFVVVLGHAAGSLLSPPVAHAQIKPGEYVSDGGHGVLRILTDKGDALRFQLNMRGANFHVCELSGVIRSGESRLVDDADPGLPCIVTFRPDKNGIAVNSKHEGACSAYCGARAHFEGSYTLPPANCTPSHVRQMRDRFKTMYDKKLFTEARVILAPIADKCSNWLTELDGAWVDNDLAIAHYRAGDAVACRASLKQWLELARTPDKTIEGNYPPSDAAEMLRIAQAVRANMKLCGAPVTVNTGGK